VGGNVQFTHHADIDGLPVTVPMIDIVSVGAGGGSLVWLDEADGLRVGPESSGAVPGPVCYGRGGTVPTVTDCDLLAGIISSTDPLGGQVPLDVKAAGDSISRLAARIGLDRTALVKGAIDIVNSHMGRALRVVTVERGLDPADFTLVAFGGAGPMHAALLARELGIGKVLVPFAAGVFSALGLMMADIRMDLSRTRLISTLAPDVKAQVLDLQQGLERDAHKAMSDQGLPLDRAEPIWSLDMRYQGQSYEVNVPCCKGPDMAPVIEAFHQLHRKAFTYDMRERPVEIVNIKLSTVCRTDPPPPPRFEGKGHLEPKGHRTVQLDRPRQAAIHLWADLRPGHEGLGPAVIEEQGFTALVPHGHRWSMDDLGNIEIEPKGGGP
jgi:N-methylhydantoinase A